MEKRNTDNVDDSLRTAVTENEKTVEPASNFNIIFLSTSTLYKSVYADGRKKSLRFTRELNVLSE